ncbi:protein kinase, putative, partial [Bodo saltans]
VWSLGVSVFMMLVGRSPFSATNRTDLIEQVKNRNPDFPLDMDPQWRALLKGMLSKNPTMRTSLSAVMRHKMFAEFVDPNTSPRNHAKPVFLSKEDVDQAMAMRAEYEVQLEGVVDDGSDQPLVPVHGHLSSGDDQQEQQNEDDSFMKPTTPVVSCETGTSGRGGGNPLLLPQSSMEILEGPTGSHNLHQHQQQPFLQTRRVTLFVPDEKLVKAAKRKRSVVFSSDLTTTTPQVIQVHA